jgi:hypothetical protein
MEFGDFGKGKLEALYSSFQRSNQMLMIAAFYIYFSRLLSSYILTHAVYVWSSIW